MRVLIALSLLLSSCLALAAEPPALAAYGRLPVIEDVVLSPSGERLAFVATANGKRRLYVQTVAGELIAQAAVDGLKVRGVQWAGDELVMVSTSQHVNLGYYYGLHYEFGNVLALDLKTRKAHSVSGGGRWFDVVFGSYGLTEKDGHWYGAYALRGVERSIYSGNTYLKGDYPDLMSG